MKNTELIQIRLLGLYVLVLVTTLGIAALYAIHTALPPNTLRLPLEERVGARMWAPQGWKFFTRDPREARLIWYVKRDSPHWYNAWSGPPAQLDELFGWKRASRAQGVEAGLLLMSIGTVRWNKCDNTLDVSVCVNQLAIAAEITNSSPQPTLCGEVAFVQQEPLPWAWAAAGARVVMPRKAIRFVALC